MENLTLLAHSRKHGKKLFTHTAITLLNERNSLFWYVRFSALIFMAYCHLRFLNYLEFFLLGAFLSQLILFVSHGTDSIYQVNEGTL